ncbi:unnamed protein product [Closterium sp. NIES-53]
MDVARTSMIHAAAPHFLWPFAVQYAMHQIKLQPHVSLPETTPTLRWTGKVGDASLFGVWGSRDFVRDTSADKLSSRDVPCVFLGFPPDAPGWQFYHPTLRRVLSSQDVTFDESVSYYRLFPYRTASLPPPPLFLAPDPAKPVEVAVDSGAARGAEPTGVGTWGAGPEVSVSGSAEPERVEPGGAEPGGAESGSLREWYARRCRGAAGATGAAGAAGAAGAGGAAVAAGGAAGGGAAGGASGGAGGAAGAGVAGGATGGTGAVGGLAGVGAARGAGAAGPGGARTGGTGAAGAGGAAGVGAAGAGGVATGVAGGTGAGGAARVVAGDSGAEGTGTVSAVSGGAARLRPYYVPLLQQVLGLPPSPGPTPPLQSPPPVKSQSLLQPTSPLPGPSPYSGPTRGLTERRQPESRPVLPESRPESPEPRSESPSTVASALVAEIVDFAAVCRLDYATSLVAESASASVCPPSVGGEVKRPLGSPPVFKARYVARGFSQRQGVDFFQTFSPTPKVTTLRVLLHVAAQRDYELHSLDFITAFLQGSLHEEIWLRRPPGFTGSFPAGTQWSLQRPVYGLRQAPQEAVPAPKVAPDDLSDNGPLLAQSPKIKAQSGISEPSRSEKSPTAALADQLLSGDDGPTADSQRSNPPTQVTGLPPGGPPGLHGSPAVPAQERPPQGEMAAVPAPSPGPTGARIAAQTFTFRELERATGGFSEKNFIGEGGFGRVYKGWLESTGQVVAVKQLDRNGVQGNREFLVEVLMLSLLHHPNLVNLIGYCADGDQRLLVYEFMPRGALEDHLHDLPEGRASLEWSKRMRVAAGAAKGLEYLHEEASPPVIYRDFKSSNILLDENWHPKLSDFGLAKLGPVGDKTHVSTRVMGTYGYCAPEYAMTGQLTVKSDVYSFGVVLLELITGRKAIDSSRPHGEHNLVAWVGGGFCSYWLRARPLFKDRRKFPAMADPLLQGRYPMRGLYQALAVAAMCLQEQASQRPMIHDVVTALNYLSSQPYDPNNNPQPSTPGRYTPGTTPLHEKKGSRSPRVRNLQSPRASPQQQQHHQHRQGDSGGSTRLLPLPLSFPLPPTSLFPLPPPFPLLPPLNLPTAARLADTRQARRPFMRRRGLARPACATCSPPAHRPNSSSSTSTDRGVPGGVFTSISSSIGQEGRGRESEEGSERGRRGGGSTRGGSRGGKREGEGIVKVLGGPAAGGVEEG